MHASGRRAGYGIDAPVLVTTLVVLTVLFTLVTVFAGSAAGLAAATLPLVVALGGASWLGGLVWTSLEGKRRLWQRVLDELELTGDEATLDLGCGRGLVLVETARRLPGGRATGIDLWRARDQSGNHPAVTRANADLEGVGERVEIRTGDVTALPFDDGTFDLVTAGHVLGSIDEVQRPTATREAARVLRPGGRIVVVDSTRTDELAALLREAGLDDVSRSGRHTGMWPPARVITATRPG